MKAALVLLVALQASAVLAKPGTPGPHYFEGIYERVGRSGGASPTLLNDLVTISPEGQNVVIRGCDGPETLMGFGPAFEVEFLMTGQQGNSGVECLFHNNGYNRPILTCRVSDGAAYTLWPLQSGPSDTPQACAE
ncbi:MAG: hypothetical protein DI533_03820 [Cereibacter sphaeroides]|uniref:Secreted protein n=1 Tax=Cereibacter sphaeroides TaxID=1063 RepID=A0A2W5U8X8_CERSP|nr:MAG: hypothetical protein DI533_03820 [Cereibacter sphaeroides]